MHVLVLGAGVIGVTTAWYARQAGHTVTVLDRQPCPAQETSLANGGQISVSHPEPWANPDAPGLALRWLGKKDAPLLWHWRADTAQWRWGMAFLRQCLPGATARNTQVIGRLAGLSLAELNALRTQLAIENDHTKRGILHLFETQDQWQHALRRVPLLRALGIPVEMHDARSCKMIEPALTYSQPRIVGGLYAPNDQSGDAARFSDSLARHAQAAGVRFEFNVTVQSLRQQAGRIVGAEAHMQNGERAVFEADATVVCLGSYSPQVLAPVGIKVPIYPVKGYSVTVPITQAARAPQVSLTDEARRVVCSRLGERLRVAGTAELNGFDLTDNPWRSASLLTWLEAHFPGGFNPHEATHWCGLRPMTPSGVPLIGPSRLPGLYLNTGHGTLGWTLACGSAAALARLFNDEMPAVDFPFLTSNYPV